MWIAIAVVLIICGLALMFLNSGKTAPQAEAEVDAGVPKQEEEKKEESK